MISRERKILRISQAHLAPGMNLDLWRKILAGHAARPAEDGNWNGVSDAQVEAVFQEIAWIVQAARLAASAKIPQIETIQPVDLYKP